jgi:hypothetical protein
MTFKFWQKNEPLKRPIEQAIDDVSKILKKWNMDQRDEILQAVFRRNLTLKRIYVVLKERERIPTTVTMNTDGQIVA